MPSTGECDEDDDQKGASQEFFLTSALAIEWLQQSGDNNNARYCEWYRCNEGRFEVDQPMNGGDANAWARLIAESEGTVIINHERQLIQFVGCDGQIAGQTDIASGPLSELLTLVPQAQQDDIGGTTPLVKR